MNDIKKLYLRQGSVPQDYIDIAPDYFVEINNYFKIVDCNLTFCRFMNKPRADLFGNSILDTINDKDLKRFQNIIRKALMKEFPRNIVRLEIADYKRRISNVSMRMNPVLDKDNNIVGLLLKFSTFKTRTEDSEVSTLFMSIYNSLTDLYTIYGTDTKSKINHVNSSLTKILGYTKEEMSGKHISEFLVKNKAQEQNIKDLFISMENQGKFTGEVLYQSKSGEQIPIHLSVSSLIHNGKVIGSLGIGRDMRNQKKLEAENRSFALQIQNQSKLAEFGMMLQGVAHNMSTPLTGIKSSAQLQHSRLVKFKDRLIEKYGKDDETENTISDIMKFFELIDQSVSKLSKIINNMMSKSRDQQSVTKEALHLGNLMEQELEFLMSNQMFKHKVKKNFDIQKDLPVIYGLYSDFSQTFVNLVKNAVDAMWNSEVKEMTVRMYYENDYIITKIKDTGKGIPKEIGDKIFKPFYTTKPRFRDSSGDAPTGTGIGLDSVVSLLKPYSGEISYESEAGKGTEFTVKIPVRKNQEELNK